MTSFPNVDLLLAPPASIPSRTLARGHIASLDGLRGAAILMVFIHHSISMMNTPGTVAAVVGAVAASLWCGVDLFFVLSGFLVTRVLLDAPRGPGYLKRFYIRRTLRVFPLYYLVVIAALVLTVAGLAPPHFDLPDQPRAYVPLLLYVTNFYTLLPGPNTLGALFVFWSLAVEEHFYLVWPFAVLAMRRTGLLWTCVAIVVGALACRVALLHLGVQPVAIYTMTVCRADALAVGAGLCLLLRPGVDVAACYRRALAVSAAAALALAVVAHRSGEAGLRNFNPLVQTVGYPLVAALMGGILTIAITGPSRDPVVWLCRGAPLRWLGKYSYGLYVFHSMVIHWVMAHLTAAPGAGRLAFGAYGLLRPAVSGTLSIAAAWVSYQCLEKHMLRLKDVLAPTGPADRVRPAAASG